MSLGFKSAGNHCCAVGCAHKSSTSQCSFLSFPTNKHWRQEWVVAVKRVQLDENGKAADKLWQPKHHHRLCSCHFSTPPNTQMRKKGWNHVKPDFPDRKKDKCLPRTPRKSVNRCLQMDLGVQYQDDDDNVSVSVEEETEESGASVSQNSTGFSVNHDHDYLHTERNGRLAEAIDYLTEKNPEFSTLLTDYARASEVAETYEMMQLKGRILSLDNIKHSNSIFEYYTGLPSYDVFKSIFMYLEPKACDMQYVSQMGKGHFSLRYQSKPGRTRVLSLEEELFVTLTRLRLGLPSKDCAKRFGVAESTFSNIFNTWCLLLSHELEAICVVLSVEKLEHCKAPCFANFSNVRIVLDCTELFSQTPGTLDNHKQQHSSYKHHSTVKFLVGMSPSGAVTYVSDMWGGRASDKKITSESEQLLSELDVGDKVMVDRGFTIAEDLPQGVKLIIPPFKNKVTGQFTAEQLEYSEKISVARIHVERAMRAIKEFRILETEVRLAMINNYENIFKTCAFLVNFRRPFLKIR